MADAELQVYQSIHELDRGRWNLLNGQSGACPFLSWDFLALLEDSAAVGQDQGWQPLYALLAQGDQWQALAPLYLVAQEAGQFTWDGGFDEVAEALNQRWYPKLVGMVPFTPAMVWRPLHADDAEGVAACRQLLSLITDMARESGLSALHLQWIDPAFSDTLADGWRPWQRQYYLWQNQGYRDFDHYLQAFGKNMRRNIRREQASVSAAGIVTRVLSAAQVPASFWSLMADYYERTNGKFGLWAAHFLPRRFFELAPAYLAELALFSVAFADAGIGGEAGAAPQDQPFALALLFAGGGRLWGRYWGCRQELPGLHFDVCYYRPIEYAINEQLQSFDPGMGGHHKARRGFRALIGRSMHQVFHPRLASIFRQAVGEASAAERQLAEQLNAELPFRIVPTVEQTVRPLENPTNR